MILPAFVGGLLGWYLPFYKVKALLKARETNEKE
jgi:hypothetical protein